VKRPSFDVPPLQDLHKTLGGSLVASIGHLIVLKALSRAEDRLQDAADLSALVAEAGPDDLRVARDAANLVVERGFHRGRDLVVEIGRLVSRREA
jgi:hypothetical protein